MAGATMQLYDVAPATGCDLLEATMLMARLISASGLVE